MKSLLYAFFLGWAICLMSCCSITEMEARKMAEKSLEEYCAKENIPKTLFATPNPVIERDGVFRNKYVFDYGPTASVPRRSVRIYVRCDGEVERHTLIE